MKSVMEYLSSMSNSRTHEMIDVLDLSVAPFKIAFKSYLEDHILDKNSKLCSKNLAAGYMREEQFLEGKVKT